MVKSKKRRTAVILRCKVEFDNPAAGLGVEAPERNTLLRNRPTKQFARDRPPLA